MNTNTAASLAPVFAMLSTDELAASIAYQAGNEYRSARQDDSLAAYRAEHAARA